MERNDHMESLAEVAIKRITFEGAYIGGASACQNCPKAMISNSLNMFQCTKCPAGMEPNAD